MKNLKIESTLDALESWFIEHGYFGYDPFDIKGHSAIINSQKYKYLRKPINLLLEIAPGLSRNILNIKPTINFKGIGLLAQAYLYRHLSTGRLEYLTLAENCLELLADGSVNGYSGNSWGYPFDWQSAVFIPKNTPSVVVSSIIGEAFFLYRELTNTMKYDYIIKGISEFLINSINIQPTNTGVCFSYTPIDNFFVHNANLFAAGHLVRSGVVFNYSKWIELGLQAVDYTVSDQKANGAITYWGHEHQNGFIDNFHTGYVLRVLNRVNHLVPNPRNEIALERGVKFYLSNLFSSENFPMHTLDKKYPIEIHTLNETLLLFCELEHYREEMIEIHKNVLVYLIEKMQEPAGCFHYKHYKFLKVKLPYYRWNQAWTFMTLSQLLYKGLF